jgi:hypothetical protein
MTNVCAGKVVGQGAGSLPGNPSGLFFPRANIQSLAGSRAADLTGLICVPNEVLETTATAYAAYALLDGWIRQTLRAAEKYDASRSFNNFVRDCLRPSTQMRSVQ